MAPLSSARLRELINLILLTDSELEAFVLDFFPRIRLLFSNNMDRTAKVNLLLTHADLNDIFEKLKERYPQAEAVASSLKSQNIFSDTNANNGMVRYAVVITATIDQSDTHKIKAIVSHLKKLSEDADLTLEEIKTGSTILIFQGSFQGFSKLRKLFLNGQLSILLGFQLENVDLYTSALGPWLLASDPIALPPSTQSFEVRLRWMPLTAEQLDLQRLDPKNLDEFPSSVISNLEVSSHPLLIISGTIKQWDFVNKNGQKVVVLEEKHLDESNTPILPFVVIPDQLPIRLYRLFSSVSVEIDSDIHSKEKWIMFSDTSSSRMLRLNLSQGSGSFHVGIHRSRSRTVSYELNYRDDKISSDLIITMPELGIAATGKAGARGLLVIYTKSANDKVVYALCVHIM